MLSGMSKTPIGVLVMAYGTASGPDDIERYYTDIRGGRPPTPELLLELKERYAIIGNRFPLLEITQAQAEGLERELDAQEPERFKTYLGMKHSPPWIADAVARMRADGIVVHPADLDAEFLPGRRAKLLRLLARCGVVIDMRVEVFDRPRAALRFAGYRRFDG